MKLVLDKLTLTNLRSVFVHVRQVDFVAEHDQPLAKLRRGQDDAVRGLAVLAIVIQRLQKQL